MKQMSSIRSSGKTIFHTLFKCKILKAVRMSECLLGVNIYLIIRLNANIQVHICS